MESAFQLGPFTVSLYGVTLAVAVVAGVVVAGLGARRKNESRDHVVNLALVAVPLGIIGARLYHVIDQWDLYIQDPSLIVGGRGLGIFGAVIGGAIGLIIYTRWRGLSTLRWLDIFAPGLLLAQAIGRWGNFFNQELYGYPTDLPWAVYIDPAHRLPGYEAFSRFHPLFLYESLWNFLGFIGLLLLGRKLGDRLMDGELFLFYIIYYSAGRFLLEGLKLDVWTLAGIPTARWITGTAIIVSAAVLVYRRYRVRRGDGQH